jgi:hypothetical protein
MNPQINKYATMCVLILRLFLLSRIWRTRYPMLYTLCIYPINFSKIIFSFASHLFLFLSAYCTTVSTCKSDFSPFFPLHHFSALLLGFSLACWTKTETSDPSPTMEITNYNQCFPRNPNKPYSFRWAVSAYFCNRRISPNAGRFLF